MREASAARRVVAVLAITETVSWGVLYYAFGVVLLPMAQELGAGRGALGGAWSVSLLASGLAAPWVGARIDRYGGRGVLSGGAVLGAAAVWAWAAVGGLAQLYVVMVVVGVAAAMVLYEPAFAVVATVVDDARRPRALLAITVVAGFAATIFLPLTDALASTVGWRDALRVLAVLQLAVAMPHLLLLPARPVREAARGPSGREALRRAARDTAFWSLASAFVLGTSAVVAVSVHLIAFLVDRGEAPAVAATAVGALGAVKVGGRVALTLAERRVPMALLTAAVFVSQGLALALLALVPGRAALVAFVLVYGAGFGAATIARPLLVAERWGTASYGVVAGGLAALVMIARAAAPPLVGLARDAAGSPTPVLLALAVVTAAAGLCLLPLRTGSVMLGRGRRPSGRPAAGVVQGEGL